MSDVNLLKALSQALDADPGNAVLRMHLAQLLLDAGRGEEALSHYSIVLADEPDSPDALKGAAAAAEAAGQAEKASSYRRLLSALAAGDKSEDKSLPPSTGETESAEETNVVKLHAVGGDEEVGIAEVEPPSVTWNDVGGMEQVKKRLEVAFLGPMRNPELRDAYKKSLRGGLLLYGPPGCGKTFIARATAGELGSRFVAIGLNEVLDMYLGESEKNLHEIFETARRNAPCLLFLDEVDALGQKRSHLRHSAGRTVVNQLLAELDGVQHSNEGIFVLAASNHPWDVDTALRRPGRLDRTVLVLPPDSAAREAILRRHLEERPIEGDIDFSWLSRNTSTFSGADLAHLCESAAELAMTDSIESRVVRPISMRDLKTALREIRPSSRPWFEVARNYAMFSNEGGQYDELLSYMRQQRLT